MSDTATAMYVGEAPEIDWSRHSLSIGVKLLNGGEQWNAMDRDELLIVVRLLERQVRPDVPAAIHISPRLKLLHAVLLNMATYSANHSEVAE